MSKLLAMVVPHPDARRPQVTERAKPVEFLGATLTADRDSTMRSRVGRLRKDIGTPGSEERLGPIPDHHAGHLRILRHWEPTL